MSDSALFGKYEKVVLLVMGFFLTTIGGAFLGSYLQNRRSFKAQQESIFEETAKQLDGRRHQTRLLLYSLKGDTTFGSPQERFHEYTAMVNDWNVNVNRMFALIGRYFGTNVQACYFNVSTSLVNIGLSIRRNVNPDTLLIDERQVQQDIQKFDAYILNSMGNRWGFKSPTCVRRVVQPREP